MASVVPDDSSELSDVSLTSLDSLCSVGTDVELSSLDSSVVLDSCVVVVVDPCDVVVVDSCASDSCVSFFEDSCVSFLDDSSVRLVSSLLEVEFSVVELTAVSDCSEVSALAEDSSLHGHFGLRIPPGSKRQVQTL